MWTGGVTGCGVCGLLVGCRVYVYRVYFVCMWAGGEVLENGRTWEVITG